MKTALVTGANGFIGKHLCQSLLHNGFDVSGISRFGLQAGVKDVDISLDEDVSRLVKKLEGVDAVYQLAGLTASTSRLSVSEFQQMNVFLPRKILMAADLAGVPKVVYVSSLNVLGQFRAKPVRTTDSYNPHDDYSRSKMFAEKELLGFPTTNSNIFVVRSPLVYGSGVKGPFFRLMTWLRKGLPVPPHAPFALRSLVGVRNLCDMLMHLEPSSSGVFHVADSSDIHLGQLMGDICAGFGRNKRVGRLQSKFATYVGRLLALERRYPTLFESFVIDRTEMNTMFEWLPPFSYDEELESMVNWFLKTT